MTKNKIQKSLAAISMAVFFLFSTFLSVTGYAGVPAGNPAVELGGNQTPLVSYSGLPSVDQKPEIETGIVDVHTNFFEGDPVLTAFTSSAKSKDNENEAEPQQNRAVGELLGNKSHEGIKSEKNSEALPEALQQQQHRLSNFTRTRNNESIQSVVKNSGENMQAPSSQEGPDQGMAILDRAKQVYYFFRAILPSHSAGYQTNFKDFLEVDSNLGAPPQEILSTNIAYAMETNPKENAQTPVSEKLSNENSSLPTESMSVYGMVPPEILFRVATDHPFWRIMFNWFLQYQKLISAAKKGFQVNRSQ